MIDESVKAKIYELEEAATKDYNDSPYLDEYLEGYRDGLHQAAKELSTAPTVDAVPVVHGEWALGMDADGDPVIYCTNCMMPTDVKTNYCQNCGSAMDGRENRNVRTDSKKESKGRY